jgi:phosphoribosylglycinamide formyltransferase-1
MTRIAVFASGRGSNFRALAEAERAGLFPGRIVLLLSDRSEAAALAIAAEFGIPARSIAGERTRGRLDADCEARFVAACRDAGVEWICLAGFMRILGAPLLRAYPDRVLNIHPSLLPAFPGLDAQRQAWDYGVKVSGCTVHLVDEGVDTGPVVLQRSVVCEDRDSAEDLASRILVQEHELYPEALRRLLTERWERRGRRIIFHPQGATAS